MKYIKRPPQAVLENLKVLRPWLKTGPLAEFGGSPKLFAGVNGFYIYVL